MCIHSEEKEEEKEKKIELKGKFYKLESILVNCCDFILISCDHATQITLHSTFMTVKTDSFKESFCADSSFSLFWIPNTNCLLYELIYKVVCLFQITSNNP